MKSALNIVAFSRGKSRASILALLETARDALLEIDDRATAFQVEAAMTLLTEDLALVRVPDEAVRVLN